LEGVGGLVVLWAWGGVQVGARRMGEEYGWYSEGT